MPFELVPPGTNIDFIGKRRITLTLSGVLLAAGIVATVVVGPKWGIDFAGGTEMLVSFPDSPGVEEGAVREVLSKCGVPDASVVRYGDTAPPEFLLKYRDAGAPDDDYCPVTPEQREELAALAQTLGGDAAASDTGGVVDRLRFALGNAIGRVEVQRVDSVGPRVGAALRQDGLAALFWACFFILIYIGFRFSLRFAPGAVVALIHDIGITAGLFVIFGLEFDLRVLAALLAIIGYSLNDTIIIYDRIRENLGSHTKVDLEGVLNLSVNQTLSRTVLTSGTTLGALLALLFVGGDVIRPFALAMTIGVVVGTYSSVFIAAPTLLFLEGWLGGEQAGGQGPTKAGPPAGKGPSGKGRHPKQNHPKQKGARAASL